MRVLVTWASKRGGTEGIARMLADELRRQGVEVVASSARSVKDVTLFDAAIIGGALYAGRWPRAARSLVHRLEGELRGIPVWLFSSGPLEDSSDRRNIPPTRQVRTLMDSIGAVGHTTFGGRLAPDARGFPASAMAKEHSGDWRNPARIEGWAAEIARALPTAHPRAAVTPPGRTLTRLALHALAGWAACGAVMALLLTIASPSTAILLHAAAAPLIFMVVAHRYFRLAGARDPLPTATAFVLIVALLDLVVVAGLAQHSLAMFRSIPGTWLPLGLVFLATWATGELMSVRSGMTPA